LHQKIQKRPLHIDEGNDLSRGDRNYKEIGKECQQIQFHKTNTSEYKAQIEPNTITVGNFNIPLSPTDRSSRPKKKSDFRIT
jgi:hypothetical protein